MYRSLGWGNSGIHVFVQTCMLGIVRYAATLQKGPVFVLMGFLTVPPSAEMPLLIRETFAIRRQFNEICADLSRDFKFPRMFFAAPILQSMPVLNGKHSIVNWHLKFNTLTNSHLRHVASSPYTTPIYLRW